MHPAFSVLIFTVTSGAGYGLLAWLGAGQLLGLTQAYTIGLQLTLGVMAMVLIPSAWFLPRCTWLVQKMRGDLLAAFAPHGYLVKPYLQCCFIQLLRFLQLPYSGSGQ